VAPPQPTAAAERTGHAEPVPSARALFKAAFLKVCADEGLRPAEALERARAARAFLAKEASVLGALGLLKGVTVDPLRSLLASATPMALGLGGAAAVGVPLAGGVVGGMALQRALTDDTDVDEAKANELVLEYRRLAEQARRHAQQQAAARALAPTPGGPRR
jgi:hypothetical protein